ncbi:MAG: hypothetical protein ACYTGP_12015 [Planctomycetota bacterium]|jgi:hypothetical protein
MRIHLPTLAISAFVACLAAAAPARAAGDVTLEFTGRYECQKTYIDHLVGVEVVLDHFALVSSYDGLVVIDLAAQPVSGASVFVSRLRGFDAYSTRAADNGHVYINLRRGGVGIARLNPITKKLTWRGEFSEPDVFFERMQVVGDRLYVAAHAYGIRIYDLAEPAAPVLVGALTEGFVDAFAVDVAGDTLYVADGAGGLKIVDISDETTPRIVAGETVATAVGTAEDVLVIDDRVYVAGGGAGVLVYERDDLASRAVFDTPICARSLARQGGRLGVADIGGLVVFDMHADGTLAPAAREFASRRGENGTDSNLVRLWHGVSAWGDDRLVTAGWDTVDIFRIVEPGQGTQPDITASRQRLHLPPAGGVETVTITNDGAGALHVTDISTTAPTFGVAPASAVLAPGAALDVTITYEGGQPGEAQVLIASDDPDDPLLPIQVLGATPYVDLGEPAPGFVLDAWTFDHATREFSSQPFSLEAHAGRLVFLHVFAPW